MDNVKYKQELTEVKDRIQGFAWFLARAINRAEQFGNNKYKFTKRLVNVLWECEYGKYIALRDYSDPDIVVFSSIESMIKGPYHVSTSLHSSTFVNSKGYFQFDLFASKLQSRIDSYNETVKRYQSAIDNLDKYFEELNKLNQQAKELLFNNDGTRKIPFIVIDQFCHFENLGTDFFLRTKKQ